MIEFPNFDDPGPSPKKWCEHPDQDSWKSDIKHLGGVHIDRASMSKGHNSKKKIEQSSPCNMHTYILWCFLVINVSTIPPKI
jgi:hypothetical protein